SQWQKPTLRVGRAAKLPFRRMGGVTNSESFCGLTMIGRRTELQPMVQFHAIIADNYLFKLYFPNMVALTRLGGFDQCPAPFAGPQLADRLFDPK
ncbi:MAG: hypothetical protein V4601_13675, partial [Pseudomonadota bacterium]